MNSEALTLNNVRLEIETAVTQMELLKVPELKSVCKSVGITIGKSMRKAAVQDILRTFINNAITGSDIDKWRPQAIIIMIAYIKRSLPVPNYKQVHRQLELGKTFEEISASSPTSLSTSTYSAKPAVDTMHFKECPFYKLKKLIPETAQPIRVTNQRGIAMAKFYLHADDWNLLKRNGKYKLYLFSGMHNPLGSRGNEPIQFPLRNEIRFNNIQVKDNVRGLKNKIGTAKPADLTPYIKPVNQQNILQLIYAFTEQEYRMYCYIVELVDPEELLKQVLHQPKILKQATLHYIANELNADEDADIITTSITMSLQCPISYTRMKYPAKSIMCKHIQCFDALWFIHSQLQVPTWQCPICQVRITLKDLAISEFVDNILKTCDERVEQVELDRDGNWVACKVEDDNNDNDRTSNSSQSDVKDEHPDKVIPKENVQKHSDNKSNEQVIISLDSDDDSEIREQNDRETVDQLTSIRVTNPFLDNNVARKTLDPSVNEAVATPTKPHPRAEDSINFIEPFKENVPNLLGRTPLNTKVVGSNEVSDPSSHISREERNTRFPSTTSTVIITAPSQKHKEPTETLLSNGGNTTNIIKDSNGDFRFFEENRNSSSTDTTDNVGHSLVLPPLPSLPRIAVKPNLPESTSVVSRMPSVSKPIISPFIPRRQFSNAGSADAILPQKRQLSMSSTTSTAGSLPPTFPFNHLHDTTGYVSPSGPLEE
ncbi:hypothetical protein NCAS_0A12090 [Naumovozyma castellii]|uniref:E3 SUMO-protein transferase SIZ2 n=1 Tax=Naumovozyma castellii TaxID=27288 RepID=G0V8G9_NAUCA|nr:hypothetical protein NCAS_0A12090 [Naumovozyma castellii CBS 4309]CCC67767.1 hypothetical protein NCAS_0A12090 [Naumovozyma castellii CBS 4309]